MHCRCGLASHWCGRGWDPGAPRANGGLGLDAPVATNNGAPIVRRIREEFISGTRGGESGAVPTVLRGGDARRRGADGAAHADSATSSPCAFEFIDTRTVRLVPEGRCRSPGRSMSCVICATKPRVLGIGFAATRDIVSHLRNSAEGRDLLGRQPTHALAFGISQAGRYLRDHLAQGFNRDEAGAACSTAYSPMSPASAVCSSTREFGQPGRTRTWHEDHDFPEVQYPLRDRCVDARRRQ